MPDNNLVRNDLADSNETVFVFRIGNLGDTLVALPAIKKIKELHSKANMVLISERPPEQHFVSTWSVLEHTGLFHEAILYRKRLIEILSLLWRFRNSRKACLYYLAPHRPKKALERDRLFFEKLGGIRDIYGFDSVVAAEAIRDSNGDLSFQEKESIQLLRTVVPHNVAEMPKRPYLHPSASHFKKAKVLMRSISRIGPTVALAPGSKMAAKKWPLERYSQFVGRVLKDDPEVSIVIIGGPEDKEEGDRICSQNDSNRVISLAGKTNIIESAAALSLCDIYVGNDTGTMHLASAMGVPCVAIFSSRGNPGRWEPFGDANIIVRKELPCSGCLLNICEEQAMRCLIEISVEEVFSSYESARSMYMKKGN